VIDVPAVSAGQFAGLRISLPCGRSIRAKRRRTHIGTNSDPTESIEAGRTASRIGCSGYICAASFFWRASIIRRTFHLPDGHAVCKPRSVIAIPKRQGGAVADRWKDTFVEEARDVFAPALKRLPGDAMIPGARSQGQEWFCTQIRQ